MPGAEGKRKGEEPERAVGEGGGSGDASRGQGKRATLKVYLQSVLVLAACISCSKTLTESLRIVPLSLQRRREKYEKNEWLLTVSTQFKGQLGMPGPIFNVLPQRNGI